MEYNYFYTLGIELDAVPVFASFCVLDPRGMVVVSVNYKGILES